MRASLFVTIVLALAVRPVLTLRVEEVDWSSITPDDDPDSYKHALDAFRAIVLPEVVAERTRCNMEVAIKFDDILPQLMLVESSGNSYRLTFYSTFDVQNQGLVITIDKVREQWSATPDPCELASAGLDVAMPLSEKDSFVDVGLRLLTEMTEATCAPDERFIPIAVLGATLVEGTKNQQVEIQVEGPAGPHRVHFEFSGAKAVLVSSDVPLCHLTKAPAQDSSIIQISEGIDPLSEVGAKRMRPFNRNRISKRVRIFRSVDVPKVQALLPMYIGELESEFHWPDVAPGCFGYGPEVQDQGSCGSAWAFATLGALSDRRCLSNGRIATGLPGSGVRRYSVQDFLSCHPDTNMRDGCKGGTLEYGVRALMEKDFSFDDESPYVSKCYLLNSKANVVFRNPVAFEEGNCSQYRFLSDHLSSGKPCSCWPARPRRHPACNKTVRRWTVSESWGSIRAFGDLSLSKRVDIIMHHIREGGPVVSSITTWDDFRPFVLFAPSVPYYRRDASAQFRGSHAVIITGWGISSKGIKYWWVRNSWGADWGTHGYFKVAQGSNSVGLENNVYFPIVNERSPRRVAEGSYPAFGIRVPWSNDLVQHRGKLVQGEDSELHHLYTFVPSGVEGVPIIAEFHTENAQVKKDVYTSEGTIAGQLVPGNFFLLAVEIRFECSEPCIITSRERFDVHQPDGTSAKVLRFVEAKLDDDSWSRGTLVVYISDEDPLQGTSQSDIIVTVQSRLRHEILSELRAKGVGIDRVKDWHRIPEVASDHTITLPSIPSHEKPVPLTGPVVPLQLKMNVKPVSSLYHNYIRVMIYASEASVYTVRVLELDSHIELLNASVDRPPDRLALLYVGGGDSIGGEAFQSFFDRGGLGFRKRLYIKITATCDSYAQPVIAEVIKDLDYPLHTRT